jgi:hypothetical protein
LEATQAIQALDTEKDIIENACKKVLGQKTERLSEPEAIYNEILHIFTGRTSLGDLFLAGILITGRIGGFITKPSQEAECLTEIINLLRKEFASGVSRRFAMTMEETPEEGIKQFASMLERAASKMKTE